MDLDFKAKIAAHSWVTGENDSHDKYMKSQAERIVEEVKNWLLVNSSDSAMEMLKFDQVLHEYIDFWRKVKKGEISAYSKKTSSDRKGNESKTTSSRRNKVRVDNSKSKRKSAKRVRGSKANKKN